MVVATASRSILLTDFRYATQAPSEVHRSVEVVIAKRSIWKRLEKLLADTPGDRIGYESHATTVKDAGRIAGIVGARANPVEEVVEQLRQSKDASEVEAIRDAGSLAIDALEELWPTVRIGERELDVAARLESALRHRGSEWHPFETIVASGPRSALPHARTSERTLEAGDFLLIDFGAKVRGYCSDITRTAVLGKANFRQREIYHLVESAQLKAREGVKAGMLGKAADALARDLIVEGGHGDEFGHSLGHGLGLEVHEAPRLSAVSDTPLPVGAVVTVEPGIYLPGWGGVRLEDDVWLSPEGPVLLTDGRTSLLELDA
jgi:Xaa-Pro aminopeptidase